MSFQAVVLAGGKGTRLAPYTHVLPKPLLPLGQRPILDLVLTQLSRDGCGRATIAVGHLGHLIELYCGTGDKWGIDLRYLRESEPRGTIGPLAHIDDLPDEPFIVMNGDVLTDLSIEELHNVHRANGAELTIAGFQRRVRDELGILDADSEDRVTAYHEKPEHDYLVSMGIYVMDRSVVDLVPSRGHMDFPDLVHQLLGAGRQVSVHKHSGYWLDLGRPDDFAQANEEFEEIRGRLGV